MEHAPLLVTSRSSYYDESEENLNQALNGSLSTPASGDHESAHRQTAAAFGTLSTWKVMLGVLLPILGFGGVLQVMSRQRYDSQQRHESKNFRPPNMTEAYYDAFVDNFDLKSTATFSLRMLVDESHYEHKEGPLVVYTGNEGSIDGFANQTGQVFLLAHHLGGRAAFIEQRYYGKSIIPDDKAFAYLSTEQVLADLVGAIYHLKDKYGSPCVVAVGGSYGGMLATWLQRRHPRLIKAAWASSAPLLGFAATLTNGGQQSTIYKIIEKDYEASCAVLIGRSFHNLLEKETVQNITQMFNLCPLTVDDEIPASSFKERVIGWLQSQFTLIANFDYPYPVVFAGQRVPANPTKQVCKEVHNAIQNQLNHLGSGLLLAALKWFIEPNATSSLGKVKQPRCRSLEPSFYSYNPGMTPGPWTYQRCYDLIMAYEVNDLNSMFLPCSLFTPNCWSEIAFADYCEATFGRTPRLSKNRAEYFGSNAESFIEQKIVLTNGDLDPWSYAGIGVDKFSKNEADRLPKNVIWMEGAAHHLDIWWPHPEDPPSVIATREKAFQLISDWVNEKQ
jgi:lysosomal Pro-X carboxypeptidase